MAEIRIGADSGQAVMPRLVGRDEVAESGGGTCANPQWVFSRDVRWLLGHVLSWVSAALRSVAALLRQRPQAKTVRRFPVTDLCITEDAISVTVRHLRKRAG